MRRYPYLTALFYGLLFLCWLDWLGAWQPQPDVVLLAEPSGNVQILYLPGDPRR